MKKPVSPLRHPIIRIYKRQFYITHLSRINKNSGKSIPVVYKVAGQTSRGIIAPKAEERSKDSPVRTFTSDNIEPGYIRIVFGTRYICRAPVGHVSFSIRVSS
jgi:hypothetical protein